MLMRIPEPDFSLENVYPGCISNYRDANKKKLMNSILPELITDEKRYIEALKYKMLHLEKTKITHSDQIKIDDLVYLYEGKLLNQGLEVRAYYDLIRASSLICPFCGKRHTTTVDHFLPKRLYPNFAVTPINLVPCCRDCNSNKEDKDASGVGLENLMIHPYEEDVDDVRWLDAKIECKSKNLFFTFYVIEDEVDNVMYKRLSNQFKQLKLAIYFETEANMKFKRAYNYYKKLYNLPNGKEQILEHFLVEVDKYSSGSNSVNSFDLVFYRTLANFFDVVIKVFE